MVSFLKIFLFYILKTYHFFGISGRNIDPRQYLPPNRFIHLNSNGITIRPGASGMQISGSMERQGGPLLDQEALASILVILFIDDPNISNLRFYRVIKNLCYHVPTRKWIIRALLSIVQKCSEELIAAGGAKVAEITESTKPDWLNIRLDSALSCRTSVFVMKRPSVSGGTIKKYESPITVHPKASPIVCRHTIDLLIFLAKSFPVHFLPLKKTDGPSTSSAGASSSAMTTLATASIAVTSKPKAQKVAGTTSSSSSSSGIASLKKDEQPSTSSAGSSNIDKPTELWDILGTLDSKISQHRKVSAKQTSKPVKEFNEPDVGTFEVSPFAQLIKILGHETVKNSSQLTDKVLRLLSLISVALPDSKNKPGTSSLVRKPPQNQLVKQLFDDNNQAEAEHHLHVIVQVLTSKACSEDGLEDATALLLNLSKCSNRTRYIIHSQLLDGAYAVSQMVLKHIDDLMKELRQLKQTRDERAAVPTVIDPIQPIDEDVDLSAPSTSQDATSRRPNRGVLQDRFTKESVIITASSKVKATCDLQLPSMAPLVSKTSSQAFFLRILKVITQIRDSVYQTMKNEINSTAKTVEPNHLELSPLSETLKLDTLWDTLSECLKELEETTDHHAVLVLQPTVEAFFLVHASNNHKNACALLKQKEAQQEAEAAAAAAAASTGEAENPAAGATPTTTAPVLAETPASAQDQSLSDSQMAPSPSVQLAQPQQPPVPGVGNEVNALSLSLEPLPFSSSTSAVSSNNITPSPSVDGVSAMESTPSESTSVPAASSITGKYLYLDYLNSNLELTKNSDLDSDLDLMNFFKFSVDSSSAVGGLPKLPQILSQQQPPPPLDPDEKKFLHFAETHRVVLNQILRQSTTHLADGPFAVMVNHTRILDFDIKRRYFRTELERLDEGIRREELAIHVHRVTVFEDSFRELYRRTPEEWKNRFYIVFEDEEGQDAGGLLREWYVIISREIFNPMYALFCVSPGDRVTYMINTSSHANPNHLCYYKFVGRVIGKLKSDSFLRVNTNSSLFFQLKRFMIINYLSVTLLDRFTSTF